MKQIQHLVALLKPLGLYDLSLNSFIYKELLVYSEELDYLYEKLQKIKNRMFLSHATQEDLPYFEQLLGVPTYQHIPLENRKKLAFDYLSTNCNGITKQQVEQSIQSCGMQVSIQENLTHHKIQVQIISNPYHIKHETALRIIQRFLPLHMQVEIANDGINWTEFDQKNITWTIWDSLEFTWNTFDVTGIPQFVK